MADAVTTDISPSQSTLSANFAPYVYDMLARGQAAASQPFQEYTGERFAGPSALQQQAFQGIGALGGQSPWQYGLGSNLAAQTGTSSFTQPGIAQSFMSPYMQNVVDVQQQQAQRQADIANQAQKAQFARAGAFGGGRSAIAGAQAAADLARQKQAIQAQGLQSAFQQAQQQFNTEQQQRLSAASGLGSLGTQQYGAGLQGLQALLGAGATQQQFAQQPLDFGYQQYQQSLQYPYQQATFMQSLLQGLPLKAPDYNTGQTGLAAALQGGLSGLALYNLFNKP